MRGAADVWRRLEDPVRPCGACGGKGTQAGDGPTPASNDPCWSCHGTGITVEPFWAGPIVFQTDGEPDADRGPRENLIAPPRGLPDDVSDETVAALLAEEEGEPSWLMLAELLEFDWDHPVDRAGWMLPEQYRAYERDGTLPEYGTWHGNEQHESMGEPDEKVLRWTEPYSRTVAGPFVEFLHRELVPLAAPGDVRIVFAVPVGNDLRARKSRWFQRFLRS